MNDFKFEKINLKDAEKLINLINNSFSEVDNFFKFNLEAINLTIEKLSEDNSILIDNSAVLELLFSYFMAKKLTALINKKRSSIKLTSSEVNSILIDAKSVVNGIEKIAVLHKKNMINIDAMELLAYIS